MYTVKQLSDLAQISVRTLHYYDEIDLLKPSRVAENGYRYYGEDEVIQLQQILFYRELDFSLNEIKEIVEGETFDLLEALRGHRQALQERIRRLNTLIQTVDSTIMHLTGEVNVSDQELFRAFTPEEEEHYAQEAREQYGEEAVNASYKMWNSYSPQMKQRVVDEGNKVYTDLVAAMPKGATSTEVQAIVARWHQHLRYFYEPTPEILRGLADLYVDQPDFARKFRALHPDLPEFLREAITFYCDHLTA